MKKKSKKNYYSDLIDSHKYNIKKTWGYYEKKLLETKESLMPLTPISSPSKTEKYSTKKKLSIKKKLAPFPKATSIQNYIRYDGRCLSTINLADLELENVFASLKTNKNPAHDDISADVVKRFSDETFVILKYIFNISLAKGVFPDKLKVVWVTPIFIKGHNTLVTNHRLISVLPCFSKLLEHITYTRPYKFLVEINTVYSKQFGFQNAHSTEHAILQLVNQITDAFNQVKYTLRIFINLSKAVDTFNHNILLEKLKAYGIQSENVKWFRSYLSNKKTVYFVRRFQNRNENC